MTTTSLIHIEQICTNCNVNIAFIQSLHELGHIELIVESNDHFIREEQLKSLESLIYFHTNLEINLEGVDVIAQLLKRMERLQEELRDVKAKMGIPTIG